MRAAADGFACRRSGASISANRMCGMALSSFDADLGTSRSSITRGLEDRHRDPGEERRDIDVDRGVGAS